MRKLLIAGCFLFIGNARAQTTIKELISKLHAGANHHSAHQFAACFAEDADFTNVLGMQAHGRKGIEKFHEPLYAPKPVPGSPSFYKTILNVEKDTIRNLKADNAAVDIWWDQTGAVGPDNRPWPPRKGLINAVAVRQHGRWYFMVFHNMDTGEFKPDK